MPNSPACTEPLRQRQVSASKKSSARCRNNPDLALGRHDSHSLLKIAFRIKSDYSENYTSSLIMLS